MIVDILRIIVNFCQLKNQIECTGANKCVYSNIYIFSLNCYGLNIDQNILERKFSKLKILNCRYNSDTNSVKHLEYTLEELNCNGICGIDQKGISELNILKSPYCAHNDKIINVNHLADKLQVLNCGFAAASRNLIN